jgi:hypothetical protein
MSATIEATLREMVGESLPMPASEEGRIQLT